jgi:hypothetical protein
MLERKFLAPAVPEQLQPGKGGRSLLLEVVIRILREQMPPPPCVGPPAPRRTAPSGGRGPISRGAGASGSRRSATAESRDHPGADPIHPRVNRFAPGENRVTPRVNPFAPRVSSIHPRVNWIALEVDGLAPRVNWIAPGENRIAPRVNPPAARGNPPRRRGGTSGGRQILSRRGCGNRLLRLWRKRILRLDFFRRLRCMIPPPAGEQVSATGVKAL